MRFACLLLMVTLSGCGFHLRQSPPEINHHLKAEILVDDFSSRPVLVGQNGKARRIEITHTLKYRVYDDRINGYLPTKTITTKRFQHLDPNQLLADAAYRQDIEAEIKADANLTMARQLANIR